MIVKELFVEENCSKYFDVSKDVSQIGGVLTK